MMSQLQFIIGLWPAGKAETLTRNLNIFISSSSSLVCFGARKPPPSSLCRTWSWLSICGRREVELERGRRKITVIPSRFHFRSAPLKLRNHRRCVSSHPSTNKANKLHFKLDFFDDIISLDVHHTGAERAFISLCGCSSCTFYRFKAIQSENLLVSTRLHWKTTHTINPHFCLIICSVHAHFLFQNSTKSGAEGGRREWNTSSRRTWEVESSSEMNEWEKEHCYEGKIDQTHIHRTSTGRES